MLGEVPDRVPGAPRDASELVLRLRAELADVKGARETVRAPRCLSRPPSLPPYLSLSLSFLHANAATNHFV